MTVQDQVRHWGIGLVLFVLLLWLLADALLPFVLGAAIAYLTDPLADWLEARGLSRLLATIVISIGSIAIVVVAVLMVLPMLSSQIEEVIDRAPEYVDSARTILADGLPIAERQDGFVNRALQSLRDSAEEWSVDLIRQIGSFGVALLNLIAVMFVTPVVAFYLLMDWDRMVAGIDDYLPREHRHTIRYLASDLNRVLAGFVRGQLTVCTILGLFYAAGLLLVGLNFGLLIGFFAGLISFIPFVGSILGGLLSVGVAIAQFWNQPEWIVAVAVIFVFGQAMEGNYLTPKLVGDNVGLHPVWLMFALSAFGVVFGFVGLLIAVPCAAAIGVLGRFLAQQYKGGRLYQGSPGWEQKMKRTDDKADE